MAQVGAVIGREFGHELLAAVAPLSGEELAHALTELVDSELVFRRGAAPHATYTFKHALVQDAAYASLLRGKRQQLHARIAAVLEERFPETAETQPELLARHFAEAGLAPQAIAYLQKAGDRAAERSAYAEAIGHLTRGLELLQALPDGPERTLQELDLRIALGAALMATRGYAGPEVEETYLRARELCHLVGETPRLFPVLHGLYRFHHVRGELQAAREAGEQLLSLAERPRGPGLVRGGPPGARGAAVLAGGGDGRPGPAGAGERQPTTRTGTGPTPRPIGIDPGVVCLSYSALALWQLGRPRQALDRSHEALGLARDLAHPQSLALALVWAAWLRQLRREGQPAREHAEAAVTLCAEQGFPLWMSMGVILQGWASVRGGPRGGGDRADAPGLGRPAGHGCRALAAVFPWPCWPRRTAGGEGLRRGSARWTRLWRWRRGTASVPTRRSCTVSGASCCARAGRRTSRGRRLASSEALEVARQQEAKSLELRAATSLAHFCADHGRPRSRPTTLLAPVHGWFTEGFDTADLSGAKALLEELERHSGKAGLEPDLVDSRAPAGSSRQGQGVRTPVGRPKDRTRHTRARGLP